MDNLWGSIDGEETGAPLDGMVQQFFFLVCDDSQRSMMAPFEMEGFACPTYFTVSMDNTFLYLDINEPCELDLPEDELFVKVKYKINKEATQLTLIVDGKDYVYEKWSTD